MPAAAPKQQLPRQINLIIQWNNLQTYKYCGTRFPDLRTLTLKQKELVYYLTQAALEGRDILFDQNGKYNLSIRRMLEADLHRIIKETESAPDFKNMEVYLKRVWFSNGIHHHYGIGKVCARFLRRSFLKQAVLGTDAPISFRYQKDRLPNNSVMSSLPVMFDPKLMPGKACKSGGR